jgi:hypothetical protein
MASMQGISGHLFSKGGPMRYPCSATSLHPSNRESTLANVMRAFPSTIYTEASRRSVRYPLLVFLEVLDLIE